MQDSRESQSVIILGAGHAGGTAAAALRQAGFEGTITLIGKEPLAPYQRPPLSKEWLKGETDAARLRLKGENFYADAGIDLRLGARATEIDRAGKTVQISNGETLNYGALIIATGSRPRKLNLPGADLAGLLTLRSMADAEALKSVLAAGKSLAIVGGGYIGLEVAASARALGVQVTVIEQEDRLLARVASGPVSAFALGMHQGNGVRVLLSSGVTGFKGSNGRVSAVRLAGGESVSGDAVLIGIGAVPNDEIAQAAGLRCDGGIMVDIAARSSDPDIYAIGDVTKRPLPLYDRMFRLESVPNAVEQARQAAAAIAGAPAPKEEVPWFWSNQYDCKLQIAGLPFDRDRIITRGDPADGKFSVFHLKGDLIQTVEAVSAPADFMAGKRMIANRTKIDPVRLADSAVPIKEVAAE
ncbi:MAG: FAD-dependent oxidoreductase [Proteobacteria bacterium]|nr:FAD-dependent oxidoreductase [Pseudomonadota bacterium]